VPAHVVGVVDEAAEHDAPGARRHEPRDDRAQRVRAHAVVHRVAVARRAAEAHLVEVEEGDRNAVAAEPFEQCVTDGGLADPGGSAQPQDR
jgi:hypothetical protein